VAEVVGVDQRVVPWVRGLKSEEPAAQRSGGRGSRGDLADHRTRSAFGRGVNVHLNLDVGGLGVDDVVGVGDVGAEVTSGGALQLGFAAGVESVEVHLETNNISIFPREN